VLDVASRRARVPCPNILRLPWPPKAVQRQAAKRLRTCAKISFDNEAEARGFQRCTRNRVIDPQSATAGSSAVRKDELDVLGFGVGIALELWLYVHYYINIWLTTRTILPAASAG
jgi:hypothetical protein